MALKRQRCFLKTLWWMNQSVILTRKRQSWFFNKWSSKHIFFFLSWCLQVLSCHIPFLVSSVEDFKDHIPRETDMKVTLNTMKSSLNYVFVGIHPAASCNNFCVSRWPWMFMSCPQQQDYPARSTQLLSWLFLRKKVVRQIKYTHGATFFQLYVLYIFLKARLFLSLYIFVCCLCLNACAVWW